MIPVLLMPAYNRHDMLLRALRSIDVPVERGLIFDNGMNLHASEFATEIYAEATDLELRIFTPPFSSIGYGGAINFGILQTSDAPWWMWVSNDVEFKPGHLATVIRRMNEATGPMVVTGSFTWGAVNRQAINAIGLVDEFSFFPIYFDDNDYYRRAQLAGVEWIDDLETGSTHGDGKNFASLTIWSDDKIWASNSQTFPVNKKNYQEKWGGQPGKEQFETPWNSGYPLWHTKPDIDSRRDRQW